MSASHRIAIAPSILAADFTNLGAAIDTINDSDADWFHVDVMDGSFVESISFGQPVIAALRPRMRKPCEVHLMVEQPERHVASMAALGVDTLTVHYEASENVENLLRTIRATGMQAGLAISPHTPTTSVAPLIPLIDLVCVMSVVPGASGQPMLPNAVERVQHVRQMLNDASSQAVLLVDGGVNADTVAHVAAAGADAVVAGSAVFQQRGHEKQAIAALVARGREARKGCRG